jgi:hypothetical protein
MANDFTFDGDAISSPTPGPSAAAVAGACADCMTWLSLEEWSRIIGINPLHFNGLSSTLFNNNVCGDVVFQYSWQHSDRVGREDICMAIKQAEEDISREAGYNLMPDWTIGERLRYAQPAVPITYGNGLNVRGMLKSVELNKGHVISGGVRTKSVIQAGAAVARTDQDTDLFAETCTVTVSTSVTDINEIHAFYPAKSGDDCWEIRPISVAISGGVATIVFKIWQIAAANQKARLDVGPLDAADPASFETTVDIYRVYNDPSTQVQFMWENGGGCGSCVACQFGTQAGCLHNRDARLGMVVPAPGSWDSDNSEFDFAEWSACVEPDQVRTWYYSGYVDHSVPRPYAELSPYWKYAIAYYAASMLDRPVCGCSNVNQFIEKWRTDMAFNSKAGNYTMTPELLGNKFGTTAGAVYAWKRVQKSGVKVRK